MVGEEGEEKDESGEVDGGREEVDFECEPAALVLLLRPSLLLVKSGM